MKKFFIAIFLFVILFNLNSRAFAGFAPMSKSFVNKNNFSVSEFYNTSNSNNSYFNSPVNLSHLSQNPPNIKIASDIPAKYDLRTLNRITEARDQGLFETAWAFASIAALESNYLTQNINSNIDLSEFHMLWFSRLFFTDREYTFTPYGERLNPDYTAIENGNELMSIAYLSRLDGPINENEMNYISNEKLSALSVDLKNFVYMKSKGDIPSYESMEKAGYIPSQSAQPQDFGTPKIRLTQAIFANPIYEPGQSFLDPYEIEVYSTDIKNYDIVKNLIMNYGAVQIAYHSNGANEESLNFDTHAFYYGVVNSSDAEADESLANNTVVIAGWDDNYSRNNFVESQRPNSDGAWLIKSNWKNLSATLYDDDGEEYEKYTLDNGYFWMSYEQFIQWGLAYITESIPNNLKVYAHDLLGWCNSYGYNSETAWAANVFKILSDAEKLESISFYTTANNCEYEFYIYDLGTDKPRTPRLGNLLTSGDGVQEYAGYHTIKLENNINIEQSHYFSVLMKFYTPSFDYPLAVETRVAGYSDFAVVHDGESYFSAEGVAWLDGTKITEVDEFDEEIFYSTPMNACIKVYTIAKTDEDSNLNDEIKINDLNVENYPEIHTLYQNNSVNEYPVESLILTLPGISPDVVVNFHLVNYLNTSQTTSKYYEFYDDYGTYDLHPQKGISSYEEWKLNPIYETGYKPDKFWKLNGIEYPVFGPFRETARQSGDILIQVNNLKYVNNSLGKIPESYYFHIVYSPDIKEENYLNAIGMIALSASDPDLVNSSNGSGGSIWRAGDYNSCNFGFGLVIFISALIIFMLISLKR